MGKERYQQLSKFLCFLLRHKPDEIHLLMDHQGFVNTQQLIKNVNECTSYELNEDILREIVDTDGKGRYEYTGDEIRDCLLKNNGSVYTTYIEMSSKYDYVSKDNVCDIKRGKCYKRSNTYNIAEFPKYPWR